MSFIKHDDFKTGTAVSTVTRAEALAFEDALLKDSRVQKMKEDDHAAILRVVVDYVGEDQACVSVHALKNQIHIVRKIVDEVAKTTLQRDVSEDLIEIVPHTRISERGR